MEKRSRLERDLFSCTDEGSIEKDCRHSPWFRNGMTEPRGKGCGGNPLLMQEERETLVVDG
jgi:hypothetical protein